MNEFEKFSADVHNAFELLGGKKSYDSFIALISASAKQDEQQRIIKLLEAISDPATPMGQLHIPGFQMREIIALIKGENK